MRRFDPGPRLQVWAATSANEELPSHMKWMNDPASAKIAGSAITVRSRAKTDFWQKTFDGYVADSGHFLHLPASGGFTFTALANGNYATQYDQAGLMVRIDAENWMRCGTEFIDGKRYASVVFTRTYSDGSTLPDLSETEPDMVARCPEERFDRNVLLSGWRQVHVGANGIFPDAEESGGWSHVRRAERAGVRCIFQGAEAGDERGIVIRRER